MDADPFSSETDQLMWNVGPQFEYCGDWHMNMYADFSGEDVTLSNWIGNDGYSNMSNPMNVNFEVANSFGNSRIYSYHSWHK